MTEHPQPLPSEDSAWSPAPNGPPPPAAATGTKRLYRSRSDRKLGGVCGGLAVYLDVDPNLVRVLTVLSLLLPGPQILAYVLAWIIVPEEPFWPQETSPSQAPVPPPS